MKAASSTSSNALDVVKFLVEAGVNIALKNTVGQFTGITHLLETNVRRPLFSKSFFILKFSPQLMSHVLLYIQQLITTFVVQQITV